MHITNRAVPVEFFFVKFEYSLELSFRALEVLYHKQAVYKIDSLHFFKVVLLLLGY